MSCATRMAAIGGTLCDQAEHVELALAERLPGRGAHLAEQPGSQ
jgi:hypothetical protein